MKNKNTIGVQIESPQLQQDILLAAEFQRLLLLAQVNNIPFKDIKNALGILEFRIIYAAMKEGFKPGSIVYTEGKGMLKY